MKFSQALFTSLLFVACDAANIRSRALIDNKKAIKQTRKTPVIIVDDGWNPPRNDPDSDPVPPSNGCDENEVAMNFRIDRDKSPSDNDLFFFLTDENQQPFNGDGLIGGYVPFGGVNTFFMAWAYCIPDAGTYIASFWDTSSKDAGEGKISLYIDGIEIDSKQDWGTRHAVKFTLQNGVFGRTVYVHEPETAQALSCTEGDHEIKVSIKTDMFGSRIGWSLRESGTVLLSKDTGEYEDNYFATRSYSLCSKGPWELEVENSKTNPGCCNSIPSSSTGMYELYVDGEMVAFGDIENSSETIKFGIDPAEPVIPDPPLPPSVGCPVSEAAMSFRIDQNKSVSDTDIFFLLTDESHQPFNGDGWIGGYVPFGGVNTFFMESAYCIPEPGTYIASFWDTRSNDVGNSTIRLYIDGIKIDQQRDWGSRHAVKFTIQDSWFGKIVMEEPETAQAISCVGDMHEVKVDITADMFGSRIGWSLHEQNGGTKLLSKNMGQYDDNLFTTYTYSVCSEGPWRFRVHNSRANPGCCSNIPPSSTGKYGIYVDGVLMASGKIEEPSLMIDINQNGDQTDAGDPVLIDGDIDIGLDQMRQNGFDPVDANGADDQTDAGDPVTVNESSVDSTDTDDGDQNSGENGDSTTGDDSIEDCETGDDCKDTDDKSMDLKVGVPIACVAGVALVALVIYWFLLRKKAVAQPVAESHAASKAEDEFTEYET